MFHLCKNAFLIASDTFWGPYIEQTPGALNPRQGGRGSAPRPRWGLRLQTPTYRRPPSLTPAGGCAPRPLLGEKTPPSMKHLLSYSHGGGDGKRRREGGEGTGKRGKKDVGEGTGKRGRGMKDKGDCQGKRKRGGEGLID